MAPEDKTRVDFNAPESLVQQADIIADLRDISRTQLLIEALQDEIQTLLQNEQFRKQLQDAFYEGRIDAATVESILGTEETRRMQLVRESLERDPPEPQVEGDLPDQEVFYSEEPPLWTPDGENTDEAEPPR